MAPTGTPRPIIDKLARAANDALKAPEVLSVWRNAGIDAARRHAGGLRQLDR